MVVLLYLDNESKLIIYDTRRIVLVRKTLEYASGY